MAVPYYERMIVADIAALKALTPTSIPAIADTIFIGVSDIGTGDSGFYQYRLAATDAEDLPNIVEPTAPTTGRWFLFDSKNNVVISSDASDPTTATPVKDPANSAIDLHIQTSPLRLWLGVDPTGTLGLNGWGYLDLISALPSYYAESVFLLNPNETNGSTTFTDLSSTPASASIISVGGGVDAMAHSTAVVQSGYGATSLRFHSTTSFRGLSFPASADWQITGDYTIEAWVYRNGAENAQIASSGYYFGDFYWWFKVSYDGKVGLYDDGSTYLESATSTVAASTWTHVAVVVTGGTSAKIYANGVEVASATGLTFPTGVTRPLYLGLLSDGTDYSESSNHYLGPIRIVQAAVYTSAFTPPSAPFPTT